MLRGGHADSGARGLGQVTVSDKTWNFWRNWLHTCYRLSFTLNPDQNDAMARN